jgi:ribonuclease HII
MYKVHTKSTAYSSGHSILVYNVFMQRKFKAKFLIGIDEAGRGPLAGPVAVGAFAIRSKEVLKMFKGARDSKKMTPAAREAVFLKIKQAQKDGHVYYSVSYSSAGVIDKKGIVPAIKSALNRSLKKLERGFVRGLSLYKARYKGYPRYVRGLSLYNCHVLLDGSLKAPRRYVNQRTIIGGDDIEPVISLASICAKVLRDQKMMRVAKKYPQYGFEVHKGYGTKAHYKAIKKHGFSKEHRKSFLKGIYDIMS